MRCRLRSPRSLRRSRLAFATRDGNFEPYPPWCIMSRLVRRSADAGPSIGARECASSPVVANETNESRPDTRSSGRVHVAGLPRRSHGSESRPERFLPIRRVRVASAARRLVLRRPSGARSGRRSCRGLWSIARDNVRADRFEATSPGPSRFFESDLVVPSQFARAMIQMRRAGRSPVHGRAAPRCPTRVSRLRSLQLTPLKHGAYSRSRDVLDEVGVIGLIGVTLLRPFECSTPLFDTTRLHIRAALDRIVGGADVGPRSGSPSS